MPTIYIFNISFAIVEIKKCANLQQIRSERDIRQHSYTQLNLFLDIHKISRFFSTRHRYSGANCGSRVVQAYIVIVYCKYICHTYVSRVVQVYSITLIVYCRYIHFVFICSLQLALVAKLYRQYLAVD